MCIRDRCETENVANKAAGCHAVHLKLELGPWTLSKSRQKRAETRDASSSVN